MYGGAVAPEIKHGNRIAKGDSCNTPMCKDSCRVN